MTPTPRPVNAHLTCQGWTSVALLVWLATMASPAGAQYLDSPMRIADGPPGQVLVSDSLQDRVYAVDHGNLAPVWSFNVPGKPMAVGFASNLVLIGNASTHNVEVYRLKGAPKGSSKALEFQFNLGGTPAGMPGTIRTPSDLAIDKDAGLVFVVDSGERSVKIFGLDGQPRAAFPTPGEAELLSPTAIAIDPQRQQVVVSDYGDPNGTMSFSGSQAAVPARIMIYTYGGQLVRQINGGTAGTVTVPPEAQFERPQGLAIDALGRIYVAESVRGEVVVFDGATGSVVTRLAEFGDAPGQLRLPQDVVIDSKSDDLLVTNTMNHRIERLAIAGGL